MCIRFVVLLMIVLLFPAIAQAVDPYGCSEILIPRLINHARDTRATLNLLSLLKDNHSGSHSSKTDASVAVPIYGVPVTLGYGNYQHSEFSDSLLRYYNVSSSSSDIEFSATSEIPRKEVDAWANCMANHQGFTAYFEEEAITPTSARLWMRRFVYSVSPPPSTIDLYITGGDFADIGYDPMRHHLKKNNYTTQGEEPLDVTRTPNAKVIVQAQMDNGPHVTAIIAANEPEPPLPDVKIRIWGNLQGGSVDHTFPVRVFRNMTVDLNNTQFNANNILLHIEQYVDNRLCDTSTLTSSSMGASNGDHWELTGMIAGCQSNNQPPTNIATAVTCFVNPKWFPSCP
jgi:hypothetical protein